jgi:transaldolase
MDSKLLKIFLDSGNPEETKQAKKLLGHLDGQTTNPTLVTKHPEAAVYLARGKKLTEKELFNFYKQIVHEIRQIIDGSISVEVYANWDTKARAMLKQAEELFSWEKNLHIKFPVIPEGLKAAHEFAKLGGQCNMTLVFDQTQSAAVYSALSPITNNQSLITHYLSPFVGRWDDRGFFGLDLIKNIRQMYNQFDKQLNQKSNVKILSASIRNLDHFYGSIVNGADIVTIPLKIISQWVELGMPMPTNPITTPSLKPIPFENINFQKQFSNYVINKDQGSLLEEGINKFVIDWKKLLIS